MKLYLRIFLLAIFGVVCIMSIYYAIYIGSNLNERKKLDCGIVEWKGDSQQVQKHSSSTLFILVVAFERSGRQQIYTDAVSWSSVSVGDRTCYQMKTYHPKHNSALDKLTFIISICTIFSVGAYALYYIAKGVLWVFDIKID